MILVTQGHERGVGLEVFFKAAILAPKSWLSQLTLFAHKPTVKKHLKSIGSEVLVEPEGIHFNHGLVRCVWIKDSESLPLSSVSMQEAMLAATSSTNPVLFTLPTTKDDLRNPLRPKQRFLGHTEYLRAHYKAKDLGMFFTADDLHVLLMTDHLPYRAVPEVLTPSYFRQKLATSLSALETLEPSIRNVLLAGLNPHAGEQGLLGNEEKRLSKSLEKLRADFKLHNISNFLPGDTLLNQRSSTDDLLVYMQHDQGLAAFKSLKGTLGANVTLGLPFLRISVDHGTAFSLYGKNNADHRGAYYCLRKAMAYRERLIGKNSGHQSESP